MDKKYNNLIAASEIASKSDATIKHGAIIMCGNKIISYGCNKNEANRKRLFNIYGPCKRGLTMHAESDAICNLLANIRFGTNNSNIKRMKLDIYVAKDNMSNSKPCMHCIKILKYFGIYRVFYTTNENIYNRGWKCEKVSQIENSRISNGNKVLMAY